MGWTTAIFNGLGISGGQQVTGEGELPSAFRVADMAVASMASVGRSLVELRAAQGVGYPGDRVEVDRRLACHWFTASIRASTSYSSTIASYSSSRALLTAGGG